MLDDFFSSDIDYETLNDMDLIVLINMHDGGAMRTLLYRYKKMVEQITTNYYLPGGDRDDLVQEGFIGLLKAVRDFDDSRSERFDWFASLCIRRQVITALKTATRQKHWSLNHSISLSKELHSEGTSTMIDVLVDPMSQEPERIIALKEMIEEATKNICSSLSNLELQMFLLYVNGLSYKEIGERLGVKDKSVTNGMFRVQKKLKGIRLKIEHES